MMMMMMILKKIMTYILIKQDPFIAVYFLASFCHLMPLFGIRSRTRPYYLNVYSHIMRATG